MKIERTKNATKNIFFGIILRLYQIIVPFLMRTAFIYCLGAEYLGLDSLFVSILQILNLAELGVGNAMIFSMYKPIAEDDEKTICALMKLYKLYYKIIGGIILIIGVSICPFVPKLIKSDLPEGLNIYILYLVNLFATVLSYWLFAYKKCLLDAHQRNDIISKITIIVYTIRYVVQFSVLAILKNYYIYLIITLLSQIIINIVTATVVNNIYPNYIAKGELDKQSIKNINQRVKDLFTAKLGGVIVNSVDTVVISAFLGLTMLAIYQNYYYIVSAIIGVVGVIFTACSAGIGNSLIVESKEKNYKDLNKFTFIILWIACICSTCLLCLLQPFMKWWVGESLLLPMSCVVLLTIYYYIYELNMLLCAYKDAAGIWHNDKFRPLITAIVNFVMNILLVNYIGIYGIILSTVLSMLIIGIPWLILNLFKEIFKINLKEYIGKILNYTIVIIFSSVLSYFICGYIKIDSFLGIILKGIVCVIISNLIWIIRYFKTNEMIESIKILKRIKRNFKE